MVIDKAQLRSQEFQGILDIMKELACVRVGNIQENV